MHMEVAADQGMQTQFPTTRSTSLVDARVKFMRTCGVQQMQAFTIRKFKILHSKSRLTSIWAAGVPPDHHSGGRGAQCSRHQYGCSPHQAAGDCGCAAGHSSKHAWWPGPGLACRDCYGARQRTLCRSPQCRPLHPWHRIFCGSLGLCTSRHQDLCRAGEQTSAVL